MPASPAAAQRADLINYLHTLADNPVPLPKAAEAGASRTGRGEEIACRIIWISLAAGP